MYVCLTKEIKRKREYIVKWKICHQNREYGKCCLFNSIIFFWQIFVHTLKVPIPIIKDNVEESVLEWKKKEKRFKIYDMCENYRKKLEAI